MACLQLYVFATAVHTMGGQYFHAVLMLLMAFIKSKHQSLIAYRLNLVLPTISLTSFSNLQKLIFMFGNTVFAGFGGRQIHHIFWQPS